MFKAIIAFLIALGNSLGSVGLFLGMLVQAIIAPIPSEVFYVPGLLALVGAQGLVNGILLAMALGIGGQTLGMMLTLTLGRFLSEPVLRRFFKPRRLEYFRELVSQFGAKGLFFMQLTLILPVDTLTYALGATPIGFRKFSIVSFITTTIRVGYLTALVIFGLSQSQAFWIYVSITIIGIIGAVWQVRRMERQISKSFRLEQYSEMGNSGAILN